MTTTKLIAILTVLATMAAIVICLPFIIMGIHALGGLMGTVPAPKDELAGLTVKQLRPLARDRKLPRWYEARKSALVVGLHGQVSMAQLASAR